MFFVNFSIYPGEISKLKKKKETKKKGNLQIFYLLEKLFSFQIFLILFPLI